ncbi:hypothetical protein Moror_15507 [Moniliophthora roreri MCA 2997]|uniref:Uncharacterized protein n=1 Tax=Moniliophthora roreri (strain MCA 2997) TaxID=1381753 RepID=V2WNZ6_MONRO|nr:hypothetical protein Moror_15507 [Moniliophthora roreri MCA 2997]
MDDLEGLIRAIEDGDVHLASEATIGAYGILTRDKHTQAARPVLISGSCKCETALEHAGLIQTTVDALDSQLPAVGLKLVSIASDGEQKCGKALVELTFKYDHPQDEELYNLVKSLQFMDLHVGDNDVMADKDGKHIDKRLRNASLRESGMFIHGYLLTPSTIHKHLCMAAFTVEHIKAVMNPNDKQDVKLAYDLLRDVWTPKLEPENITPGNADAREAIYTFGSLCFWLIYPYICVDLSLAEQLKYLSAAAHLAFALYRDEKAAKKFLPTTLYVDIQIMIKNVFFCVAKAKRDDPDGEFFIILLGTDRLEILFGIVRTLVANNCNLDILQLADRLNGALEVANILALHPEWDKTPRRLKLPMVTRDDTVISTSTDHITPEHWCGCLRYKLLSLLTLWNGGRKLCEDEFPWTRPIFESAEMEKASFLSPLGKLLVTEPLDPDDIEEEVEDEGAGFQNVSEAMDGLQLVEEEATAETVQNRTFSRTVDVDGTGKQINKSRVLATRFRLKTSTESADQLRRVQAEPRFKDSETGSNAVVEYDSPLGGPKLLINDPIASLIKCEDGIFLCIGEVRALLLNGKPVDELSLELLLENIVSISYQVICLHPSTTVDDESGCNDWKSTRQLAMTFTVPGRLVRAVNADLSIPVPKSGKQAKPFYLFDSAMLITLASSLQNELTASDYKLIPTTKWTSEFPYREKAANNKCPSCSPKVELNTKNAQSVLAHMGAHVLFDNKTTPRTGQHCGFCLRPWPVCSIYLGKWKGSAGGVFIDMKRSTCGNLLKLLYATAQKCTQSSPCTNIPIQCPLCPNDLTVFKYNFPEHFATKHPTVAPAGYQSLWAITDIEKELMHDIWKGRHQVVKRRKGKKKSGPPLPISEAHSSRNAIRHDVNIDEEEERLSTEDSPDEYESDESTISNDSPTSPHPVYDDSEEEQETSSRPKFQDDEEFNDLYLDFDDDVRYLCRDAQTQPEAPAMEIEKDAPPAQEDNPACTENETPRKRQLEEDEPEEGRRTRRRTVGRLLRSTFHVCHCGDAITEEEKAEGITVVRCKRLGCETEWV